MYILGLSSYAHESSCALIKNGEIKSIIEEERLNREKHTWKLPKLSIKKCLEMENISINDIDYFTFFWQPKKEISGNLSHFMRYFPATLNTLTTSSGGSEMNAIQRISAMKKIGKTLQEEFNLSNAPHIEFVEHHLAHVASSFFVSPFEKSAILILDGRGESISTSMYHGEKNNITKISETKVPHSLGHFYAAVTDYLGFKPFFDEWKVMGMSAYGKNNYVEEFSELVELLPNGQFRLNLKYFNFHTHGSGKWVSDYFIKKFGEKRNPNSEYHQKHFDVAFGLQRTIEKIGVHIANFLYDKTKLSNLCLAGGVALNVLMNREIIKKTPFKNLFIQPIAHDAGTSFGSALYFYNYEMKKARNFQFKHTYWGPEYTNKEIEKILVESNLTYHKSNNIAKETAQQIADEKIIGWFQGRMEAGPRALGNRSITVSPLKADMKDRLNERVKRREYFRPFAPSVLEERVSDFFEMPKNINSPYMILSGEVKEEKRQIIPAVTHADNTARVHTVNSKDNLKYWSLIHEFEKITGVPVLLNTSFNENEPIVCTPKDAVECFLRTDFDILSIGDFLISKS